MRLIIAGSRTFSDYQRLCQVLAPDRQHITQVITGGARGADQLATAGPGSTPSGISSSAPTGSAWQVSRHQAQSPDGAGRAPARGVLGGQPRHRPHGAVHALSWANPSWSSARTPRHKKSAWHMSRRFSRASELRESSVALVSTPLPNKGVTMTRPYHIQFPSAQAHAIADLTGYEDAATLRWQQACVQAANTLTALPNGRDVNVRMERMRQGLELAQRGAVSLPEDGEQLSAVVRSGHNLYQVDTRLLTCTCADYQKHLQACKHLLVRRESGK